MQNEKKNPKRNEMKRICRNETNPTETKLNRDETKKKRNETKTKQN